MAIGYGVRLKVWGDYACFTRPEMKTERVSYDVITPSAARGILEAIHWKPAIRWKIDKIHVLNPIKFDNVRRNERSGKIPVGKVQSAFHGKDVTLFQDATKDAVQRASLVLRDVCYGIEAHFEVTNEATSEDTIEKHYNMALRRIRKGQCFHQPYFGCREFPVRFELIEGEMPRSCYTGEKDLGFMLYDIDFDDNMKAIFYRAVMVGGVIDVQRCLAFGGVT
ncbi:MAG: type I-C CRISPR-associated protein Cas5c [Methanomicrobiales archaeon]|nr:type I-C CRISPR-associated protein Cas5c [Methanomicrobiales archaeon]